MYVITKVPEEEGEGEGESHVTHPETPAPHSIGAGEGVPAGRVPCWSSLYQHGDMLGTQPQDLGVVPVLS